MSIVPLNYIKINKSWALNMAFKGAKQIGLIDEIDVGKVIKLR